MRAVLAAGALALTAAAPAAAVSGNLATMKVGRPIVVSGVTGTDKSKSCQAGKKVRTKAGLLGSKRRFATVACEQPPRSELVTPSSVAKATAAALSVLG